MAELDLEILYRSGEKNVVADVLSRYGADGAFESTTNATFSMGDSTVSLVVQVWLSVVAKHMDFDACVVVELLSLLLSLVGFT